MIGPGKYDEHLSKTLNECGAKQGILLVFDGKLGPSFCCQLELVTAMNVPAILRKMAEDIERDLKKGSL